MKSVVLVNTVSRCGFCPAACSLTYGDVITRKCLACGCDLRWVVREINDVGYDSMEKQLENLTQIRQEEVQTIKAFKKYLDKFGDY